MAVTPTGSTPDSLGPPVGPVPSTTPAGVLQTISALVGLLGPIITWINPGSTFTPGEQTTVSVALLAVGAVIFTIHSVLAAVHAHGMSMAALTQVSQAEASEFKALWPDFVQIWPQVKPLLAQMPATVSTVTSHSAVIQSLSDQVARMPQQQQQQLLDAIRKVAAGAAGDSLP